jgi:hypothetical protein
MTDDHHHDAKSLGRVYPSNAIYVVLLNSIAHETEACAAEHDLRSFDIGSPSVNLLLEQAQSRKEEESAENKKHSFDCRRLLWSAGGTALAGYGCHL